jgi:WD40 repeat protein
VYSPIETVIRDALTGDIVYSLQERYDLVALSPGDGRYLAGARYSFDTGTAIVEIWDRALNALETRIEYAAPIETLLWHPNGEMLVTLVYDRIGDQYMLVIDDLATGELLFSMPIDEGSIALSHDGSLLSHEHDGAVTVYPLAEMLATGVAMDAANAGLEFAYPGVVFDRVRWHPSEQIFAVIGEVRMGDHENSPVEDYLYIWDISAETHTVTTARVLNTLVDFTWRPDGTLVYATRNDRGVIHLWEQIR